MAHCHAWASKVSPCSTRLAALLRQGQEVRPLVLLDGDDAGRVRRDALMKELYVGYDSNVLMLDEVLNRTGQEVEIEDILGEEVLLAGFNAVFGNDVPLKLDPVDRSVGSLPSQIKAATSRQGIELTKGWKASIALYLVSSWAENGITLSGEILDQVALLFTEMNNRFDNQNPT